MSKIIKKGMALRPLGSCHRGVGNQENIHKGREEYLDAKDRRGEPCGTGLDQVQSSTSLFEGSKGVVDLLRRVVGRDGESEPAGG